MGFEFLALVGLKVFFQQNQFFPYLHARRVSLHPGTLATPPSVILQVQIVVKVHHLCFLEIR